MSYISHDISTGLPDLSNFLLNKKKSIYEIRDTNDKQLWFKVNQSALKYGYGEDKFKADGAGNIVIEDLSELSESVEAIDQFVVDTMTIQYEGKILNNIMITKDTVQTMFRPSMYNGTLRVKVELEKNLCRFYDTQGKVLSGITANGLSRLLTKGLTVQIFIQPSFVWMFNGKIGVTWKARQIKLSDNRVQLVDQPEPDSDEDGRAAPVRSAKETLALFNDASDEEV